jgi:hypothetical protein
MGFNDCYLHYLIPALFPPHNADIPLPDLKMGRQNFDQGFVGPTLDRRGGKIDLEAVFLDNYLILFGFGDYPDGNQHIERIFYFQLDLLY